MSFFAEYGLFLAKTLTIAIAIIAIIITIAVIKKQGVGRDSDDVPNISSLDLNDIYRTISTDVRDAAFEDDKERSQFHKEQKKKDKAKRKKRKDSKEKEKENKPLLYVLDFEGDIEANSVESLRTLLSAIIQSTRDNKEQRTSVLLRLESPGGAVNAYGLAASQLDRLRSNDIPLIVAIDKVAASGGYMMASVANTILAAPFAVVGSIGVVASLPNFHRLLKEKNIDYEQITAGEFKRTLTVFGENDDTSRDKVKEELEDIHGLFKNHISQYRPDLNIDKVATGEVWLGSQAKELGLVDEVSTSDDYLMQRLADSRVVALSIKEKKSLAKRLGLPFANQISRQSLRPYL